MSGPFAVTIGNVISAYLYGTSTPPANLEDRLRPAPPVPTPAEDGSIDVDSGGVRFEVDTTIYMLSVGRYANLFQTSVVKDFFANTLDLSKLEREDDGSVTFTLGQLYDKGFADDIARVTISHYTTDPSSADFVERAFIWGTTNFILSDATTFTIDGDGTRSIINSAMLPAEPDNFDFVSPNPAVQFLNENVLKPLVDPYNIGQKIWFDFSEMEAWQELNNGVVIVAADNPNSTVTTYVNSFDAAMAVSIEEAGYVLGGIKLAQAIGNSVEYYKDGYNIVYGTSGDDILSSSSVSALYDDVISPIRYITGDGNDQITATRKGDIVFSGGGNDTIHLDALNITVNAGAGDDTIYAHSSGATITGGTGSDVIDLSGDPLSGGSADRLIDASANDKVKSDQYQFTGNLRVARDYNDGPYHYVVEDAVSQVFSADDHAIYKNSTNVSGGTTLTLYADNGNALTIDNFDTGDAGLLAVNSYWAADTDLPFIVGNRFFRMTDDNGDQTDNFTNYKGFVHLDYFMDGGGGGPVLG